jgi:Rad52/22 family double-strand break repair protein
MALSRRQLTALKRSLDNRAVRTREANGRQFSYLEGWYVISEANRIFGHDGWSRETLEAKCVVTRENRGTFLAIYTARVRITVHPTTGPSIIREGHGSGEGRGGSLAEVHDIGLKAAETDATKRALATFGKPFGLELYRSGKSASQPAALAASHAVSPEEPLTPTAALAALKHPVITPTRTGLHPDDTTPIPRPSRYHGRGDERPLTQALANARTPVGQQHSTRAPALPQADSRTKSVSAASTAPPLVPSPQPPAPGETARIDKSALAIPEPKRLRDKAHLKFVASQPCLICGRQPSDPHHLRFAQPRAIGMKVSDEFTVPLCRGHHRQLHQVGNEVAWWEDLEINALEIARGLWEETHPQAAQTEKSSG